MLGPFHARTHSLAMFSTQESKSWDVHNLELPGHVCYGGKSGLATLLVSVNSNTSHTTCTDADTLSAHHIALILCTSSGAQGQLDCLPKVVVSFHLSRAMSLAPHRTPRTSASAFSTVPGLQKLLTSRNPCADPRFSDPSSRTGYEPNRIVDNQIINEQEDISCTEDNQITEIEVHVKILSYNQSLLSCNQDSIESLATPQEADVDDEQIRALLASPRYLPEREASAERLQVYHSEGEGLMSSSSQSLNFMSTGQLVACLSHQKRLGQTNYQSNLLIF